MRKMTMLALVAVLALSGAACGGDDDSGGDDGVVAGDDGATDDGGDGGGGGDAGLAEAITGMGGCTGAAAAISAVITAGFNPAIAEGIEENQEFLQSFATSVPDEIKEDVELLAEYSEAAGEVLGDFSPEDYADPVAAQEIGEAFEALQEEFPQDEMNAANESISAWFTEECPAAVDG